MRVEPYMNGWLVRVDKNEIQFSNGKTWPLGGTVGFISQRGAIRVWQVSGGFSPREWTRVVRSILEGIRDELWQSGALRNPQEIRRQKEEARTGSFLVQLNDGRERRFHSFKTEFPSLAGTAMARPGAYDWILDEFKAGRASYAEMFRSGTSPERQSKEPPAIYTEPIVYPARQGFDRHIVREPMSQFPMHALTRNEYGSVTQRMPAGIKRAYDLKRRAMKLVEDRWENPGSVTPEQIASEWDVASDAFEEESVPFQADYARANADYWWRRANVSSRRRVNARRGQRHHRRDPRPRRKYR